MSTQYEINKGVNRPIEFRGLKAQYIFYLAIGLAVLLVLFSVMYITGVPVYLCLVVILAAGSGLFFGVFKYSHKYGEFGLMKAIAYRRIPAVIVCHSAEVFRKLSGRKEIEV